MKLMEAATVRRNVQLRDYRNQRARECGVEIYLSEFCDDTPENIAVMGTANSAPGDYRVTAFPIAAFLRQGVFCEQPDDQAWFTAAFENHLDYALTYALTVEHIAETEVWTNAPGVQTISLVSNPTTDQRGAAVAAGRRQWFKSVVSADPLGPILHVPPSHLPALKFSGVVLDKDTTVWGDRVVCGEGYDEHPQEFWSGPIGVELGVVESENVPRAMINSTTRVADVAAAIDIVPCSIVRIGSYTP